MNRTRTVPSIIGLVVFGLAVTGSADAGHRSKQKKGKHHEHMRRVKKPLTEADILRMIACGRILAGVSEVNAVTGEHENLTLIDENARPIEAPAGSSLCRIAMALNARGSRVLYVEPANELPPVKNPWSYPSIASGMTAPADLGGFVRDAARQQRDVERAPMYSADGTEIETRGAWSEFVEIDTLQPERFLRRAWVRDDLE